VWKAAVRDGVAESGVRAAGARCGVGISVRLPDRAWANQVRDLDIVVTSGVDAWEGVVSQAVGCS